MAVRFQLDDISLGWIAGIIEGEGCITKRTDRKNAIVIQVGMTDEDVLIKLHQLIPGSILNGPYHSPSRKNHWKPRWNWELGKREYVKEFLILIYPLMGNRRRIKIREALETLNRGE
jgi:hypothetical protein